MEQIKEQYVSYGVAKLLKEKGFDEECSSWYSTKGNQYYDIDSYEADLDGITKLCSCPTHQMAMAWLREKYDFHIIAYPYKVDNKKKWCCQVFKTFNLSGCEQYTNETLNTYDEAVEAALKYTLENLVQNNGKDCTE